MKIIDLEPKNDAAIQQAANLLVQGFRDHWPNAWPDQESAMREVQEALQKENINRVAINDGGDVIGWIGGIPEYDGNAWELHPLVVSPAYQGKGIGQALIADFEMCVKERGGITIFLGTDDEDNMTTLSNTDLYSNLFEKIENIENLKRHPYEFYQKQGYAIVGVIPDANGLGKPDIIMAKCFAVRSLK
jgi:aminoglycoside 6'-N-acetyltransferase I